MFFFSYVTRGCNGNKLNTNVLVFMSGGDDDDADDVVVCNVCMLCCCCWSVVATGFVSKYVPLWASYAKLGRNLANSTNL